MRTPHSPLFASFLACATVASGCNHAVEAADPTPIDGTNGKATVNALQAVPLEQLGEVRVDSVEFEAVTSLTRAPNDNIVFALVVPGFDRPVQLNEYRVTDAGAFQFLAATCPTETYFAANDFELSLTRVGNQDLLFGAYDFRDISLYDVTNPGFIRCKTFNIAPRTDDVFEDRVSGLDTEGDVLALVTQAGDLVIWRFASFDAPPTPIHRSRLERADVGRLSRAVAIDFVREPSAQPGGVEGAIYVGDTLGVSKWYLENGSVRYLGNVRAGNSWRDLVVVPIPPFGAGRPPQRPWVIGAAFNGLQVVHAGAPKDRLGVLVGRDNGDNDFLSSVETLGRLRDTRVANSEGQTINDVVGDLVYATSERLPSNIVRYNFDSIDFTNGGVVELTPDTVKQFGPQRETPHDVKAQLNANLVFVAGEEGLTSHSCTVSRDGIAKGTTARAGLWALLGMCALAWRRRRSRVAE